MAAAISAQSQEVGSVLEEPSSRDATRNFQFRLCCPAKSSPNSPGVLPSEAATPSNAAKIIEPTGKERELHYARTGAGRGEPGTAVYIYTEGPRIENKPERTRGTNGWAVICP